MKKTIKKRAFVSAIAMLIVSAIVLTSSTFAWFSMSKEATIDQMNLSVSSPEGIQISANASAWTSNLSIDEIFNADTSTSRYKAYEGNINLMPVDLIPASSGMSAFKESNAAKGYADFFRASVNDRGTSATVKAVPQTIENELNCGLVAFDLFFKVANTTEVNFSTSEFLDPSDTDILTALRVGFQFMGNVSDPAADNAVATAIALKDNNYKSSNFIYEVDSQNRSIDALDRGNASGNIETRYIKNTNAAGSINADFLLSDTSNTGNPACGLIKDTAANTTKVFNLDAGITKVRIYIWIEGNDIDCRNSVAGSTFTAALKFTIK